jgi:thiol:disulfide interchange protein DsbD
MTLPVTRVRSVRWADRLALALVLLLLVAVPARAGDEDDDEKKAPPPSARELVQVAGAVSAEAARGTTVEVTIPFTILKHWHINAHVPNEEFLVPTVLALRAPPGVKVGAPRYPKAKSEHLSFSETALAVYEDDVEIVVPLTVEPTAAAGARTIAGTLRFQACNDDVCLPPASVPVRIALLIPGSGEPAPTSSGKAVPAPGPDSSGVSPRLEASADSIGRGDSLTGVPDSGLAIAGFATGPPPPGTAGAVVGSGNLVGRWFTERGSLLAFLLIFLMGLALNLTPCVYPMMGVTVSLFGGGASAGAVAGTRAATGRPLGGDLRALPRALVYVLGITLMYSTLGVVAAMTGGLFGGWLGSPWVLGLIGVLLLAMALSMFGFYELQAPGALLSKLGGATGAGYVGTFLAGLLVGVFAAPCIGPPIIALLAYVGAKGDPWFGFQAFFMLSLGLGLPYLVLAVFSGLMARLPRSGSWMDWVKHLFGVILLGVAAFYLTLAVAPSKVGWVVPAALALGGLYLGFLEPTGRERMGFRRFKWAVGVAGIVAAAMIAFRPAPPAVEWQPFAEDVLADAAARGRPVLIDFSADWCVPCHELDERTFTHPDVVRATASFVRMKVDLTRFDSPESQALRSRFAIAGVPTIVFLAPDGIEVGDARVVGFLKPEPFLERVRMAGGVAVPASR